MKEGRPALRKRLDGQSSEEQIRHGNSLRYALTASRGPSRNSSWRSRSP